VRVVDRLEPLVGGVLARDPERDVGEPGVGLGAVPVLDAGAREHDDARRERDGVPALLLVPAGAGRADEDLAAAAGGVVDVPVVAAARGEGDVVDADDALALDPMAALFARLTGTADTSMPTATRMKADGKTTAAMGSDSSFQLTTTSKPVNGNAINTMESACFTPQNASMASIFPNINTSPVSAITPSIGIESASHI